MTWGRKTLENHPDQTVYHVCRSPAFLFSRLLKRDFNSDQERAITCWNKLLNPKYMPESIDMSLVDWSRGQFALTAMFHWIFVPLTLGLSFIVAFMHTIYVRTGMRNGNESPSSG